VGRDPRTEFRGSSFAARASWTPDQGLLGMVAGSGSNWFEGWGVCWGWSGLGPRVGDGAVEAETDKFIQK
jgi:hypothetical protein